MKKLILLLLLFATPCYAGSSAIKGVSGTVPDKDYGDITVSGGAWGVEDSSHAHSSATITEADPTVDSSAEIQAIIGAGVYGTATTTAILSNDVGDLKNKTTILSNDAVTWKYDRVSSETLKNFVSHDTLTTIVSPDVAALYNRTNIISADTGDLKNKTTILSNDAAWSKSGIYSFLINPLTRVGIGTSTAGASLDVASTATTGNALSVTADSLTLGNALSVRSNSANSSSRYLAEIVNDNASATSTTLFYGQQDANADGMFLRTNATVGHNWNAGLTVAGDSLTTGRVARFYSNSTSTSARNVVEIANNNAAASKAIGLYIDQNSGDYGLKVDGSGRFNGTLSADTLESTNLTIISNDVSTLYQKITVISTDTKGLYFENPTAADDLKSIWRPKQACTLMSIWAESDQTVSFFLEVDDGSPLSVDTAVLAPAAGTAEDTALNGDTTMAAGDRLDLAILSVANTPTWVSIQWTFRYDN